MKKVITLPKRSGEEKIIADGVIMQGGFYCRIDGTKVTPICKESELLPGKGIWIREYKGAA